MASRLMRRGGGTALPGLVAERVDPNLVRDLADQLGAGSVVVAGTNGKTTTARILSGILEDAGLAPMRNESGSNLMRGLASALVHHADARGNLAGAQRRIGLFEVDEAALPAVLRAVRPGTILLLDLFRDQLDRYGEVASVARVWADALADIAPGTAVVANADDPLIVQTVEAAPGARLFFGIESAASTLPRAHASDVKACPRCGGRITYTSVFLGHLGHYSCSDCGLSRPEPAVRAADVEVDGVQGSRFNLVTPDGTAAVVLPIPGMYNVYNAIAAAALAVSRGMPALAVAASLGHATAAFGRMERIAVDGRSVYLALAKNPTGLNEVIRTLTQSGDGLHLLAMLNDNAADGKDVSWIWDADVELLAEHVDSVVFAGTRAEDIALRFKYAGVTRAQGGPPWSMTHDTDAALSAGLAAAPEGGTLFIVPTYTAMLDVRDRLVRRGHVAQYWEA